MNLSLPLAPICKAIRNASTESTRIAGFQETRKRLLPPGMLVPAARIAGFPANSRTKKSINVYFPLASWCQSHTLTVFRLE